MTAAIYGLSTAQSALIHEGTPSVIFGQGGIISGIGKNKLRNGDFSVNQMAVSGTVVLAAGAYGHDMWKAGAAGCTYTFVTVNNVTTVTITAGSLIQVIEGKYLQSGTYCLGWGGTAQGKIGAGAYGASGITGVAVGGTNLNVEFGTGTLLFVQFESGTQPSYFEFRLNELQLCQVYYETKYGTAQVLGSSNIRAFISKGADFAVTKRAIPSLVFTSISTPTVGAVSDYSGGNLYTIQALPTATTDGISGFIQTSASMSAGSCVLFTYTANARL